MTSTPIFDLKSIVSTYGTKPVAGFMLESLKKTDRK